MTHLNDEAIFQLVYDAILRRDSCCDGRYYSGIVTTGIFCRPSCRSRTPKPGNVRVYASIEAARQAGFRPCKRCRPEQPGEHGPDAQLAQSVNEMIRLRYSETLTLPVIAAELLVSPYHLQRVYKRTTGTTPSKQLLATRIENAKQLLLHSNQAIADIASAVGFRGASHFSAVFLEKTGCSPHQYRERRSSYHEQKLD